MTPTAPSPVQLRHIPVVIVGAGVAGLSCAGRMLQHHPPPQQQQQELWLLEAQNRPGGRVWDRKGAEMIHGTNTALTRYLMEHNNNDNVSLTLRPIYTVSHADGGPTTTTLDAGQEEEEVRYGQWYMNGRLYRATEHPDIMELRNVLDNAASSDQNDPAVSMQDVIPPHLQTLAKVSFGNTAGCTDLSQISASMVLHHFDTYWEENEEAGDYFLDADLVGMLVQDLSLSSSSSSVQLKLRHAVQSIAPMNLDDEDSPLVLNVIVSSGGEDDGVPIEHHTLQIKADSVVLTVPPKLWPKILHPSLLSDEKLRAIQYVGMEPAIKIVCRYQAPCWDPNLQQIICMDEEPIPEIWFDGSTAVGFLMSEFATQFPANDHDDDATTTTTAAIEILTRQLSKILQVPIDQFVPLESSCTLWKDGGYMFPRVGMTPRDLEALASPTGCRRLYFAGEATHTGACCTIQAAMETGYRAANSLLLLSSSSSSSSNRQ